MFLRLTLGCLLLVGLLSSPTEAQETCFEDKSNQTRSWGGKDGWEPNEAREQWFFEKDKLRGVQYEVHHYRYNDHKWERDGNWVCFKVEASSCSKNYTDPDEIRVFESSDLEAIRCLTQNKGCPEFVNTQEFVNGVLNLVEKKAQYSSRYSRKYVEVLMRRSPVSPNLLYEIAPANRGRIKVATRLVAGDSLVSLVMAATLCERSKHASVLVVPCRSFKACVAKPVYSVKRLHFGQNQESISCEAQLVSDGVVSPCQSTWGKDAYFMKPTLELGLEKQATVINETFLNITLLKLQQYGRLQQCIKQGKIKVLYGNQLERVNIGTKNIVTIRNLFSNETEAHTFESVLFSSQVENVRIEYANMSLSSEKHIEQVWQGRARKKRWCHCKLKSKYLPYKNTVASIHSCWRDDRLMGVKACELLFEPDKFTYIITLPRSTLTGKETAEELRDKCIEKYSKHQVLNVTEADILKSHYEKCECIFVPRNRINATSFSGLYPIPAGNRGVVVWEAWKLCTAPELAELVLKRYK
eukprot:g4612.t1